MNKYEYLLIFLVLWPQYYYSFYQFLKLVSMLIFSFLIKFDEYNFIASFLISFFVDSFYKFLFQF